MMLLTDRDFRKDLFPITCTRHTADIRIGILTIREKWERLTGQKIGTSEGNDAISVRANIIPTKENFEQVISDAQSAMNSKQAADRKCIDHPWNIFQLNDYAIRRDFALLTENRASAPLSATNKIISRVDIFLEEGAVVEHCIINASAGPVYIGKDAEIMEGCMLRGPLAICAGAKLKMGTKIYGASTIGPNCIAGGEIKNSVLFANSNKAHDGYLGDSVLGEWCNLGAGTSNSNVKNTGGEVKYIIRKNGEEIPAGTKAGLLMGDYSRSAINTSFNTGSVVGVCCNIFGSEKPLKYTDHFSWGDERYIFDKVIRDIDNWKKMKGQGITESEILKLRMLYDSL